MEDKTFELMEKMYSEFSKRFDKMDERFDSLEARVIKVELLQEKTSADTKTLAEVQQSHYEQNKNNHEEMMKILRERLENDERVINYLSRTKADKRKAHK